MALLFFVTAWISRREVSGVRCQILFYFQTMPCSKFPFTINGKKSQSSNFPSIHSSMPLSPSIQCGEKKSTVRFTGNLQPEHSDRQHEGSSEEKIRFIGIDAELLRHEGPQVVIKSQ